MTLVSSFSHTDMDPSRIRSGTGTELLRLYLQFASTNGRDLGDGGRSEIALNSFEEDVFQALTERGIGLIPQWGSSGYRIDMVAQHPERPGEFVLAIECDGASYHSAPTARDRDRLRQRQLEALGWRFHRIWSTDWFMRREEEIERAVSAYQFAVTQGNDNTNTSGHQGLDEGEGRIASTAQSPNQRADAQVKRKTRPDLPLGLTIDEYSHGELVALAVWINSDGRLRTDDEIIEEMKVELGFKRRGSRIEAALRAAAANVGRSADPR